MARTFKSRFLTRLTPVLLGAGLFSFAAVGCTSQEDYLALKMERDNLAEQVAGANANAERQKALADSLRAQIASMGTSGTIDDARYATLQQQLAEANAERDATLEKYQALIDKMGQSELPPLLISELDTWARENPNLVDFDAKLGIVKFKSDVTFASGDAELTAEAKAVIGKFAQIINGPVAKLYRLEIAGHTDNVPVESGLTKSKGHKDNWYLSSHRAISVASALMSQGVANARIGVTGYADQRPVADNSTPAGKQANRRVEVLILPTPASVAEAQAAPAEPEAAAADVPAEPVSK